MKRNYFQIVFRAIIISIVGVYGIDYFSHLLFSNPMETLPYFIVKFVLYLVFSILFISFIDVSKKEFTKVIIGGIVVASIFGIYYNILPLMFDFYPAGISLSGLTFLGMELFGTGLAFGTVHTLAFVGGYYFSKFLVHRSA
ncbi:MAG TPA: hypothetical protein P5548_03825 [Candidatus Moranbacteria bacterium]|nr:hypothetical protein [Candidatus Moranbacteria bacterium]